MAGESFIKSFIRQEKGPDWQKSFLMIAYFLLLGIVNLFNTEVPFYVLAWPLYVFPRSSFLAAIFQLLFVYLVASIVDYFIKNKLMKHSETTASRGK